MTQNRRNDLILSEALATLVDQGSLSEGSHEYWVAQAVVRDGEDALGEDDRRLFRAKILPLLGNGYSA